MTKEDAVAGIAATTTWQGLKVTAVLDEGHYPAKVKISDQRMKYLEERVVARHSGHGESNYAIRPAPAGPEPEPPAASAPAPDLQGLAALARISDFAGLLAAVALPRAAARAQRLLLARVAARTKNSGGMPSRLPFGAIVAAARCDVRLAMPSGCSAICSALTRPPSASPPAASPRCWQRTASPASTAAPASPLSPSCSSALRQQA